MIHSRTKKHRSKISFTLAWIIFFQAMLPLKGLALTSGPSQPEFNSFEPVGTTQMVDPFTGNFVYNIPLFELPGPDGGYPFNLSYKPDGNINSESGPFGYGWTINPGVISRNVRGIPDDHKGDAILETTSIKDNWTIGADFAPNIELAGLTGVNASFGLYYNNYRGVGVNLAAGVSLPLGNEDSGNSLGLNASFDSQEGFDVSPSIGIGGILKANTSINSRRGMSGLSLSLGAPLGKDKVTEEEKDGKVTKTSERVKSGSSMSFFGSNISLAGGSHSPSLNMPWNSFSLNGKVRLGASLFSIFGNASVGGSFSRQSLKNKGKEQKIDGYGYMFLEESLDKEDEKILLDFSREKDGPITKRSPNLGIPMTTPDVFSASGQGMAGMFRPYRSDIGIVYDSKVSSQGGGGSFSFDAPVLHVGGSGSISFSSNKSGKWDTNVDKFDFKTEGLLPNGKINNSYEKYYFKTQGEKVSEATDVIEKYVGGEEPMRFDVNYLNANPTYKNKEGKNVESDEVNDQAISTQRDGERKPRGLVIQDFNNVEAPSIPLLDVEYYDREIRSSDNSNSSIFVNPSDLERSGSELVHLKPDHIAGFISTDTKGVRYAYGIPAYNKVEENYVFSVPNSSVKACHPLVDLPLNSNKTKINYEINGTDEFIKHTKKPAFAHSYLLTSVLGSDYIDVNNNGPSVEDLGYWVKFNYSKIHDDYKWRSPYIQAFADSGVKAKKNDDKGSFTYGEKEIWMLGTVETKTHIAVFITEERKDALEAVKKFSNAISDPERSSLKALHRVKEIKLFTRSEWENPIIPNNPIALRTIHLEHEYLISNEVPNAKINDDGDSKKMALTKVWFTSENSDRGELNPYEFAYGVNGDYFDDFCLANEGHPRCENYGANNPGYTSTGFDRWGTYQEVIEGTCGNIDFPYTKQPKTKDEIQDLSERSSVWNLKNIKLPSGSEIQVDWEAHRYTHVQNQEATAMVPILATSKNPDLTDANANLNILNQHDGGGDFVKLYFQMEENTSISDYTENLQFSNRLNGTRQLYFKSRVKLFPDNVNVSDRYQDINGYLDILGVEQEGQYGVIKVAKLNPKGNNYINHHPISVYAWQYMKQQLPEFLVQAPSMPAAAKENEGKGLVRKLASSVKAILNFFTGFYKSCRSKGFAAEVDLANSYIKLCVPKKEKFGGGARVKQITLHDSWEENSTYGQYYKYSGGVTSNEPGIGNDENALRYAKTYPNNLLLATDEVNYFEFPINENLYPGPSIGYSKVEVISLATHLDEQKRINSDANLDWLPDGISTTGKVVHEFYTAKDFPVIVDETKIDKKPVKGMIPIFPMGVFNQSAITASQGYAIIKNDMHGKPKRVSNFAQDINGNFLSAPYNYVNYNYKHKTETRDGKQIKVLDNLADVLLEYNPIIDPAPAVGEAGSYYMPQEQRLIGVDYELINDLRENISFSSNIGGQFNTDFLPFPPGFPVPTLWFTIGMNNSTVKTAATNKMIFKSGILESVEAYDGGSYVETKNLLFDKYTGEALLTQLTNEYDNPVFNLNVPGHLVYDGMGASYRNSNLEFLANVELLSPSNYKITFLSENLMPLELDEQLKVLELLNIGDTYKINGIAGSAVFKKLNGNFPVFEITSSQDIPSPVAFKTIVSGRKNQLSSGIEQISGRSNPTKNITKDDCLSILEVAEVQNNVRICDKDNKQCLDLVVDLLNAMLISKVEDGVNVDFYSTEPLDLFGDDKFRNSVEYSAILDHLEDCLDIESKQNKYVFNGNPQLVSTDGNLLPIFYFGGVNCGVTFDQIPWSNLDKIPYLNEEVCVSSNGFKCSVTISFDIRGTIRKYGLISLWSIETTKSYIVNDVVVVSDEVLEIPAYKLNECVSISANELAQKNLVRYSNELKQGVNHVSSTQNSYNDIRESSGSIDLVGDPVLSVDGKITNVSLFNFDDPFFERCDDKWIKVSEITQYDKNNEVENKDALGIYSSALFGYKNDLATATAQNARYLEIGYENFEGFNANGANNASQDLSSHLDIGGANGTTYQSFNLISGKNNVIILDEPFDLNMGQDWSNIDIDTEVKLNIRFRDGSAQLVSATVVDNPQGSKPNNSGNVVMVLQFDPECEPTLGDGSSFEGAFWAGTIYIPETVISASTPAAGLLSTNTVLSDNDNNPVKAHSGDQFLAIPQGSNESLELQTLRLIPGKDYYISAWVARNQMHPNLPVMMKVNGADLEVASDVIEGWVKVEKTFTATYEDAVITFHADPITVYTASGDGTSVQSPLYLDDMRIQPANSSMVTYVYDPVNYRLMASLDENNFATFYEYDHEGRLTTVKKETERGIKTIQHNQSFLATSNE